MPRNSTAAATLVDIADIAARLGVSRHTVYQWGRRRSSTGFPEPDYRKSNVPLWHWWKIEKWAKATGRLWE